MKLTIGRRDGCEVQRLSIKHCFLLTTQSASSRWKESPGPQLHHPYLGCALPWRNTMTNQIQLQNIYTRSHFTMPEGCISCLPCLLCCFNRFSMDETEPLYDTIFTSSFSYICVYILWAGISRINSRFNDTWTPWTCQTPMPDEQHAFDRLPAQVAYWKSFYYLFCWNKLE